MGSAERQSKARATTSPLVWTKGPEMLWSQKSTAGPVKADASMDERYARTKQHTAGESRVHTPKSGDKGCALYHHLDH